MDIKKIFEQKQALLTGHFKLSSGLHSSQYLQCAKVLQYPEFAEKLCKELAGYFKKDKPTCVVAPALGGIMVSYEVARALGVRGIFTERKDGKMALKRGFELTDKDRVLVVEDVITTGLSTKEVLDVVKSFRSNIIGVGSIVDRTTEEIDFGVKFISLLKLDIQAFKPEECELCKQGIEMVKHGSR